MKTFYAILAVLVAFVYAYAGGDHLRPPIQVNMLGRIGIFILAAPSAYIGALRECPAYILLYQFSPKDTGQSKVK